MEVDALFAAANLARREADAEQGEDDLQEDDDPSCFFVNAPRRRVSRGRASCHPLPDGDFHMCFGMQCAHVSLDRERQLVCAVTGMVVGVEHARDHDPAWTGRSTGSANPDDTAGTPQGGWVRRRDMFSASVSAYRNAHSISDADTVPTARTTTTTITSATDQAAPTPDAAAAAAGGGGHGGGLGGGGGGGRAAAKRGALCVDEVVPTDATPNKKQRSQRRESWSRDALEKLAAEALQVIAALLIVEVAKPDAALEGQSAKLDPRLQNPEFVRGVALRKYVRACAEGRQQLNLNVLHNVCVYANEFVRGQREASRRQQQQQAQESRQEPPNRNRRGPGFSGQVRNLIANLIVSLWRATCATPHMRDNKRGNDSFRPFAAGVLYSFKRGIYLDDGTCVVPALDALAVHLPALRSPQSTHAAKQLQSSSHRGICSFHRSISSMGSMEAGEAAEVRRLFSDAAGQAAFLRALVHQDGAAQR